MRLQIEPLSAVPGPMLRDHLLRYGLKPEIIEWKYFDPAFGHGRDRGFAWLRDGRVAGMVGMIPYVLTCGGLVQDCAWTCDWVVESSEKNPGIGVLLFKGAIERAGLLTTLGGNDATARLVPRLATHIVADAATVWSLVLRVGGTRVFGGVARRAPLGPLARIGDVPVRRVRFVDRGSGPRVEAGVSPALADMRQCVSDNECVPSYDHDYLDWQLGRCPGIESASVLSPSREARAGALCWRLTGGKQWRMALWVGGAAEESAHAVVWKALNEIARRGGHAVSAITSRTDAATAALLENAGFRATGRELPLYVLSRAGLTAPQSLARLSYLDSDLAHRF